MLSRLIVNVYGWIIEIWLWFVLLVSAVVGFHMAVSILKDAGAVLENELAWKILGAVVFPLFAFLALAVLFGPILVLVDIRKSVRALEVASQGRGGSAGVLSVEYKKPHL
jgi:hypothetical protein